MGATLRRLWKGWQGLGRHVGDFQARLILTIFYFTVAVPFGVLVRLTGGPLRLYRPPTTSAWLERGTGDTALSRARRQF